MVGGRTVEVDVALSQDDARSLAQGKGAAIASKDNRNMYLVWRSLVLLFAHLPLRVDSWHFLAVGLLCAW